MTTLFDFQFPESQKMIFCWDADVRPKSEIHPFLDFKNLEFPSTSISGLFDIQEMSSFLQCQIQTVLIVL